VTFDYEGSGIHAVVEKLKAALSKMPAVEVQPGLHLPALQAFNLTAQVPHTCRSSCSAGFASGYGASLIKII